MLRDGKDDLCLVYLSGPMTGVDDHGLAAFAAARATLRDRGYSVLCPSEVSSVQPNFAREDHLRRDFNFVLLADEVCVLPGWQHSKGAVIEVNLAIALSLPVWEFQSGLRIDGELAAGIDVRRSLLPVDFGEWAGTEGEEVHPVDARLNPCRAMRVLSRGASASPCDLPGGHPGPHRNEDVGAAW